MLSGWDLFNVVYILNKNKILWAEISLKVTFSLQIKTLRATTSLITIATDES